MTAENTPIAILLYLYYICVYSYLLFPNQFAIMATTVGHPEDCMRPEVGNNCFWWKNTQYQVRVREGLNTTCEHHVQTHNNTHAAVI